METQRVRQPFMKVSMGNMCSFFCKFYYILVNTVRFNEEKSYCISVLTLLLMFLGKPWIGKLLVFLLLEAKHIEKTKTKENGDIFVDYLCVNALFKSSMFPNSIKLANVTPLRKKGRKALKKTIDQLLYFQLYNFHSNICFLWQRFLKTLM